MFGRKLLLSFDNVVEYFENFIFELYFLSELEEAQYWPYMLDDCRLLFDIFCVLRYDLSDVQANE